MEREVEAAGGPQNEPATPSQTDQWLLRADAEGWTIRWSVHFRTDSVAEQTDGDGTLVPNEPRFTGDRLLVWFAEAIGVTLLFGLIGILLPFSIIWLMASAIDHHEGVVRAYLIFSYFTMTLGTIIIVRSLFSRSWWTKRSERLFAAMLAVFVLPWFMYATSAPGMMQFEVMTHAEWSPFWRWIVFWGYLFLDVVALGAPEAFFGHMASLQPASWSAALNTFLVRAIMTIGAIWCMWSFLADRIRGRHEFIGTVDDLRQYLSGELGSKQRLRVYASAVEQPLADGPQGQSGERVLADLQSIAGTPTDSNASSLLNRVHPPMMVGVSVGAAVTMSTLLLIGFYIREPSLFIAKTLIWLFPVLLALAFVLFVIRRIVSSEADRKG